jgi:CheY-like chemotaxis protein
MAMTILALVPDLFFLSRLRAAAAGHGLTVEAVRWAEQLVERATRLQPALVVIDMGSDGQDWASALRALQAEPATAALPVIAFGPHVDRQSQATARAAGATRVLSNSGFTERLSELLADYAAAGPPP